MLDIPNGSRYIAHCRPLGLEAWIRDVGCRDATQGKYEIRGSRQSDVRCAFQYTLAGCGELELDGEYHAIPVGHVMLVRTPSEYCYRPASGMNWRFFYLSMEGAIIERVWLEILEQAGPVLPLPEDDPALQLAADFVQQALGDFHADPWRDSETAYALAMRTLKRATQFGAHGGRTGNLAAMEAAVDFAHRHFLEPIGVDDLARVAGLSRYHFSRLFRSHTGVSPGEFILRERLQYARNLLESSRQTVRQIALASGFNDAAYFGKQFKQRFRLTPGQYRTP